MADEPDDDPTERKSSRGGKKRFQERDEPDDDDDDRPRKKRRGDDHVDDDRPKKKRRVDDGPRVKTTDIMPIVMLLAFIGSAVALLVICAGCGVWSFDWLVGGGPAGGGGGGVVGGREFEVVSANRTPGFGALSAPNISYVLKQNKELSGSGVYVVVMRCGGVTTSEPFPPPGKGGSYSSTRPQMSLRSTSGKLEVWVERRQNPVASGGTVVSNTYVVP